MATTTSAPAVTATLSTAVSTTTTDQVVPTSTSTTSPPITTTSKARSLCESSNDRLGDPSYYTQGLNCFGITIKAPAIVHPLALEKAAIVVTEMFKGLRSDVAERLIEQRAAIAIIPVGSFVTSLPEFAYLSGQIDRNGNAYDSFEIRGLGAVPGQPVTATSEENLRGLPEDRWHAESITHHEFAHAVMNLGFSVEDQTRWGGIYAEAVKSATFPGAFAMVHPDEYWAELTQSYFSVNNEIGGPEAVQEGDPEAFAFLKEIYGNQ